VLLAFLAGATLCRADVVWTKGGAKFEGRIVEETEQYVTIELVSGGSMRIPRQMIERIKLCPVPPRPEEKSNKRQKGQEPGRPRISNQLGFKYLDILLGFGLRIPRCWKRGPTQRGALVSFFGPHEAGYPPRLDVMARRYRQSLEEFVSLWLDSYRKAVGLEVTCQQRQKLPSGLSGVWIEGTFSLSGRQVAVMQLVVADDEAKYMLCFFCNQKSKQRYQQVVKKSFLTFETFSPVAISQQKKDEFRQLFNEGGALMRAGKLKEAVVKYRAAAEIVPQHLDVQIALATVYHRLGQLEDAKEHFRKASRLSPDYPPVFFNLGTVHYQLEELEEASTCYRRATELDPSYVMAYVNLAAVQRQLGEPESAIETLRKAVQVDPSSVVAHLNLAALLEQGGDKKGARQHVRRVLELDPDNKRAKQMWKRLQGR
jgi:tetratricopeptide (TPR) repeat protein